MYVINQQVQLFERLGFGGIIWDCSKMILYISEKLTLSDINNQQKITLHYVLFTTKTINLMLKLLMTSVL